ncbi:Pentatricopeptide repeat-containing protein [Hibiscus syriacus]|uniref:Pentatricopeptide repeat-containing protein n=1 Tax=Hibiscus syriacus TaxID=106335 RepID=A0A6A3CWA2_HIBSY|nr:Pentatricopeptide repeat-containing protein [Hibiscus syriacus]
MSSIFHPKLTPACSRNLTTTPANATGGGRLTVSIHPSVHCSRQQIKRFACTEIYTRTARASGETGSEKEEPMLRVSEQDGGKRRDQEEQRKQSRPKGRCLSGSVAVSMNRVSDSEVSVQISGRKVDNRSQLSVSDMLHYLEQQGFLLLNASSFESFGGIVFYNIHLQMGLKTACKVGSEEALREKLLALCDHREDLGL